MVRIRKKNNEELQILIPALEFKKKYNENLDKLTNFVEEKNNIEIYYVDYNYSSYVEKDRNLIDFDSEQHNANIKMILIDCKYKEFETKFEIKYPLLITEKAIINIDIESFDSLFIIKNDYNKYKLVISTKYTTTKLFDGEEKELKKILKQFNKVYSEITQELYKNV